MSYCSSQRPVRTALLAAALVLTAAREPLADELVEWLFWNEIGNAVGVAADSYADYVQERQLWAAKIVEAKAELERCGECASAQAELDKWQGIENRFQEVAGELALASGMPPIVAQFLGINLPMAPTRSPEERARECEIVRRDWVGQRPAFCQSKVDAYLGCLRDFQRQNGACTADVATVPGGHCWELYKYYEPCRNEDYAAVERERKKEEARAAGAIIPDYARYGTSAIVVYGLVPDDFLPQLPPSETVLAALGAEHTQEVKFRMRKERVGALRQITVKYFHWSDVAPQSRCFESASPTDEIGRRVCDDLAEMSFDHHPPLLTCYYVGPRLGLTPDAMYWYGARPATPIADPAHLLTRSSTHPLTQIGESRTDCPPTIEEAKKLDAQYRATLANLGLQQVPDTVALRSDREIQRQAEHDARVEAEQARLLAAFPIEGAFTSTISTDFYPGSFGVAKTAQGKSSECVIKKIDEINLQLDCQDIKGRGQPYTASGVLAGSRLVIRWSPDLELWYTVGDCASIPCLHGEDAAGPIRRESVRGMLVRESDFGREAFAEMVSRFRIEGAFDLEVTSGVATLTARCTIEREQGMPSRFPMTCITLDGQTFEGLGVPDRRDPASIGYNFLFAGRSPMSVRDQRIANLRFPITASGEKDTRVSLLTGKADQGVTARLVRVDPQVPDAYGTPLEELPELQGGDYARWARRKGVTSLEQLAELSDAEAAAFGMGWIWRRDLARQFLEGRAGGSADLTPVTNREVGALERKSAPVARPSPQAEPAALASRDQSTGAGRSSTGSACTVDVVAGTYKSIAGDITCKPGGGGLECCYGGPGCQKMLHLQLTENGRSLTGEWEHQGRQKGPAEFGVTDRCELTHGRWGFAPDRMNSNWRVAGRR